MKGIAHFAAGVAVASCFPEAVKAGAAGNPLYFILGGMFGLLPDTLDFKFYRYFFRHDIEVAPDPNRLDPQMIADAVALAVRRAYESGRAVNLKLDTIRLGADLWRQYSVKFDVPERKVVVTCGPIVNTGQSPVPGTEPEKKKEREASAPLSCGIKLDYEATTTVDIFDGPMFTMKATGDGRVSPVFIPWHREWSHSLVIGLLFALAGVLAWGPAAGLVIFGAYAAHALVDHLGFLGCNLFYPFHSGRREGFKLLHSDQALPNFAIVWVSCMLIFWNLCLGMSSSTFHFNILKLVFYGALLPAGIYFLLRRARFLVAK